jgi:hypothetical protein
MAAAHAAALFRCSACSELHARHLDIARRKMCISCMAEIFSLSKARKANARATKEQQAQQNRILFGRSKAEKMKDTAEKARAERSVEAHRIAPASKDTPNA